MGDLHPERGTTWLTVPPRTAKPLPRAQPSEEAKSLRAKILAGNSAGSAAQGPRRQAALNISDSLGAQEACGNTRPSSSSAWHLDHFCKLDWLQRSLDQQQWKFLVAARSLADFLLASFMKKVRKHRKAYETL